MARAKNTTRAEARRRHRAARAAVAGTLSEETTDASQDEPTVVTSAAPTRPRFAFPNVLADLRALPGMFRTRKLLWLPFLLLLVAFGLQMAIGLGAITDSGIVNAAFLYIQLILPPTALFPFFIGGFLAPRASYLVGFLLGLFDAILIAIVFAVVPQSSTIPAEQVAGSIAQIFTTAIVVGTLAAAFAAWYRNFLRGTQERARQARLEREAKQRTQRKEQEREARRSTSQRPT